jgi:hypothetical protein
MATRNRQPATDNRDPQPVADPATDPQPTTTDYDDRGACSGCADCNSLFDSPVEPVTLKVMGIWFNGPMTVEQFELTLTDKGPETILTGWGYSSDCAAAHALQGIQPEHTHLLPQLGELAELASSGETVADGRNRIFCTIGYDVN